jgi:hypothetical protein
LSADISGGGRDAVVDKAGAVIEPLPPSSVAGEGEITSK